MVWIMIGLIFVWMSGNVIGFSLQGAQPAVSTTLSSGISASDTTIPVNSFQGFLGDGQLHIGNEIIVYSATETPCVTGAFAGDPACATSVTRGDLNSTATSHPGGQRVYNEAAGTINAAGQLNRQTAITNFGSITNPIQFGKNVANFIYQLTTWDWPMFDGDFEFLRVFAATITLAILFWIGMELLRALAGIL